MHQFSCFFFFFRFLAWKMLKSIFRRAGWNIQQIGDSFYILMLNYYQYYFFQLQIKLQCLKAADVQQAWLRLTTLPMLPPLLTSMVKLPSITNPYFYYGVHFGSFYRYIKQVKKHFSFKPQSKLVKYKCLAKTNVDFLHMHKVIKNIFYLLS